MCNDVKMLLLRAFVSLLVSTVVFSTLILRYFTGFPSIKDREILNVMQLTYTLLPVSLVLLLIKDIVLRIIRYREYIVLISLIFVSIYSLVGSLADIIRLEPGKYIYIPPMFIIVEYHMEVVDVFFKSIIISVPLCTTFIIFVYGLCEIIRTYRALKVKELGKAINRLDVQVIHNIEGQGQDS